MDRYSEDLVVRLVLALMEETGRDEIRVSEEALDYDEPRVHLMMYRDAMRGQLVYRRVVQPEVIDAEEVPAPALAIGTGQ